ncbi:MAG: glycosyl transferase [Candidatus Omnitrophica bacterium CG11_big_fil_rev_8_21_14_0_20_63_9]|nr:MAG: glycosyl transferase [Candidatus Omnitrophica bacterium CG11_big_fil_rev_8_21_14_0_20_63_9]
MPSLRVDIAIPVLNEAQQLQESIETLVGFLRMAILYKWRVVILDNGSTDGTGGIGRELAQRLPNVTYRQLAERGRGRALREAWSTSDADIYSYMDVDLSTNLNAFPSLIDAIANRGFDVAIGSRLMRGAQVKRSLKREAISRGYNGLVKTLFRNRFSDGQCGFKAIRTDVAKLLLPHIMNQNWFFDTELLLLAERFGFSIAEVPVAWIEDLDSRVKLFRTACEDVQGLLRVRMTRYPRPEHILSRQAVAEPARTPAA